MSDLALGMALQGDGKIVVGGCGGLPGPRNTWSFVGYSSAGGQDDGFDGDGKLTTAMGTSSFCLEVALLSDGKFLGGGHWYSSGHDEPRLVRYTTAGAPDTGFGGRDGIAEAAPATDNLIYAMAVERRGDIVLGGARGTT